MKNKIFTKLLSITLVCVMLIMSMGAYGVKKFANASETLSFHYETTQEERVATHNQQLNQIKSENTAREIPTYAYKYNVLDVEYVTVEDFVGNQNIGGYRFNVLPAGFYHSFGGTEIQRSVTTSFGLDIIVFSVSVDIGKVGGSGIGTFHSVPNTTDYFKLRVKRVMEVRPVAIYRKPYIAPDYVEYEYWRTSHTSAEFSLDYMVVKVG